MSRLVIADGGARMLLNQIRICVEGAKGSSLLIQQAGAKCPDLVGTAFYQLSCVYSPGESVSIVPS